MYRFLYQHKFSLLYGKLQKYWVSYWLDVVVIVVQWLSCVQLCDSMDCDMPRLPCPLLSPGICSNSCPLSQWCHPTISSFLHRLFSSPSIFSNIRVFSNESALCIRWPKYWSFSFSISHSNEYSRLISYRIDWLDLHAVQRSLKSLLHTKILASRT